MVQSYEWWKEAASTHSLNLGREVVVADIRALPLEAFPRDVDFVVGSPPCTQFSFANRGGNGDIADGLKDIEKFLEVVNYVQPRAWAMENVPRVAGILRRELAQGGTLERFAQLVSVIEVVDASDWGVPQRRKRMIAGNFDVDLLRSYRTRWREVSMGEVITGLSESQEDPVYGVTVSVLTDNVHEVPLTPEEARMNREAKTFHRVYNNMSFPDQLERPARTVTATCTRVSRESIVVEDSDDQYRRLSVRERASLQSFPAEYQFYGKTHGARVKMIGNAVPPLLTMNIAHSFLGTSAEKISLSPSLPSFGDPVESAVPPQPVRSYPANRRFAAAVPGLRFGSGTRFELSNSPGSAGVSWSVKFFFGTSKDIREIRMDSCLLRCVGEVAALAPWMTSVDSELRARVSSISFEDLQDVWCGRVEGHGPFELIDVIGAVAENASKTLPDADLAEQLIDQFVGTSRGIPDRLRSKINSNSTRIFGGLVAGALTNSALSAGETG